MFGAKLIPKMQSILILNVIVYILTMFLFNFFETGLKKHI